MGGFWGRRECLGTFAGLVVEEGGCRDWWYLRVVWPSPGPAPRSATCPPSPCTSSSSCPILLPPTPPTTKTVVNRKRTRMQKIWGIVQCRLASGSCLSLDEGNSSRHQTPAPAGLEPLHRIWHQGETSDRRLFKSSDEMLLGPKLDKMEWFGGAPSTLVGLAEATSQPPECRSTETAQHAFWSVP